MFNAFPSAPMAGPPRWFVKSVTFNGENITDIPLDVSAVTDDSTLEIVMTDKQTTLSGTVKNARGQPVIDYTVVIFPDAAAGGRDARPLHPRRAPRSARSISRRAAFRQATIWPRRSSRSNMGGHWDPAFRKQVEPTAKRFRLTEGQTATIDLTLTP